MIPSMSHSRIRILAAAFLLASSVPSLAQVSLRDDIGRAVSVKNTATRIVTLAPFLTELVYAAGAGDRVVGVSSLSDYPPAARTQPQIPTGASFSFEAVAKLKPDLVLAWSGGISRDDVEHLAGFGATVFVADARKLEDVPRLLKVVALLTSNDVTKQVADYEAKLESLRRANAQKPKLAVFLEIWNRPLTTISGTHFMSEALEICRGENVFKDIPGSAPKVSWEEVFERNPYAIVGAGSASTEEEFRANWTVRQSIVAVKENRLLYVDIEAMQRPSVRTPDGVAQLCDALDKLRPGLPPPRPAGRSDQYGM
jgi:iron complex transport system substrate-binding protein